MKMSDVWGWDAIPQNYTEFNGFKHDNGNYDGKCYGLIFLTEEAAEAQAHALRNHDRLTSENEQLRVALKESNEVFRRELSKYFYKDEASMLNTLERNKKLLTELEKGDE